MNRGGGEIQPGERKHVSNKPFPRTPAPNSLPEWYPELPAYVTRQVSTGRSKVSAANRDLLASYYASGRDILERQNLEGWGAKIIERLPADRKDQFPDASGFSPRNLKYIRAFAETWPAEAIVQSPLSQMPRYQTDTMARSLPKEFSSSPPSISELEAEVSQDIYE
jgi:hypothetical protein